MHEFVPLHVALRSTPAGPPIEAAVTDAEVAQSEPPAELSETLAAVRRFRAALADAFDAALERLLYDVAAEVVARELRLAPADIGAIAERALRRMDCERPIRLRVHPEEIDAVRDFGCDVIGDPALRRGDLAIDLRDGSIDVTLGARLEDAIAASLT